MTIMRPLLFILLGLAISTVIDAGALYYAGKTPQGRAFIRDFLVAQSKKSISTPAGASALTAASTTPPGILPIPQAYATREYFLAINNVIQDLFAINATNERLGPLLDVLNQQTLSCSYAGFYEAMGQAHRLANKNQTLASQLAFHLTELATANVQTKDVVTKANTQALVVAGTAFTASLQTYASAANGLLAGDTPTSAQIADFQSKVNAATGASQSFADAFKPLLQRIIDANRAAIEAASSTPVR